MHHILNYLIEPYLSYTTNQILLESIACVTGIVSVIFAIRKNILVYPIGIVSTTIYTYLLYRWTLYGEMLINGYYTLMSIYGWLRWYRLGVEKSNDTPNNYSQLSIKKIFAFTLICFIAVLSIYIYRFGTWTEIPYTNYMDSMASASFLVAMYLMARMDIRNWHFWIFGNALSIPLFLIKGYGITSIQYVVFLALAIQGLYTWHQKK